MSTLSKEQVRKILIDIHDFTSLEEVHKKAVQISLSDIDLKAKVFLNKAIDLKIEELTFISNLAVDGEVIEGELDD